MPAASKNNIMSSLTKWGPLSDLMNDRIPNRPKCSNRHLVADFAVASCVANNSVHLENVSTTIRKWSYVVNI